MFGEVRRTRHEWCRQPQNDEGSVKGEKGIERARAAATESSWEIFKYRQLEE
jgi:hypothetical protein